MSDLHVRGIFKIVFLLEFNITCTCILYGKKNKKREENKELGERDILDMETNIWKATCGLYIALDRWIVVRKNLETPNKVGNSKNAPV